MLDDLAPEEHELLALCDAAHAASARRGNISGQVLQATAVGSGNYANSIAAALLTLGGAHGPLTHTHLLLRSGNPQKTVAQILNAGRRVPGWGNGFHKGKPDPLWTGVAGCLEQHFPAMHATLENITASLHAAGKTLYPNPSAYTAATAILLGMPAELTTYLFLRGRLEAWTQMFQQTLTTR